MRAEAIDPTAKSADTKHRLKIGNGYLLAADGSIAELTQAELAEAFNNRYPAGCYVGSIGTDSPAEQTKTKKVKHD